MGKPRHQRALEIYKNKGKINLIKEVYNYVPGRLISEYCVYDACNIKKAANSVEIVHLEDESKKEYNESPFDPTPKFIQNESWSDVSEPRKIYELKNVSVIGSSFPSNSTAGYPSFIYTNSGYLRPSALGTKNCSYQNSISRFKKHMSKLDILKHKISRPDKILNEAFLSPFPFGSHYAKWHYCLCALRAYEDSNLISNNMPIISAADRTEWVDSSLSLIGYNPETLHWLQSGEKIFVKNLYVPSYRPRKGRRENQPLKSDFKWLKNRLTEEITDENNIDSDKIYVSRQESPKRHITNYEEFKRMVTKKGFVEIRPEEYTYEQQISIFDNANILIGPHGSGLMNMLFSTDANIIEIVNKDHWRTSNFFILANEIGHEYNYILANPHKDSQKENRHENIHVNIEKSKKVIELVSKNQNKNALE